MNKRDIKIITNSFICRLVEVRRDIKGFKAEIRRLKIVETEIIDLNKRIRQ